MKFEHDEDALALIERTMRLMADSTESISVAMGMLETYAELRAKPLEEEIARLTIKE